jgi:hypothetical protein
LSVKLIETAPEKLLQRFPQSPNLSNLAAPMAYKPRKRESGQISCCANSGIELSYEPKNENEKNLFASLSPSKTTYMHKQIVGTLSILHKHFSDEH